MLIKSIVPSTARLIALSTALISAEASTFAGEPMPKEIKIGKQVQNPTKQNKANKQLKEEELNKQIADLEAKIAELKSDPKNADNKTLQQLRESMLQAQTLSRLLKTFREDAIDQMKWEDQDGVKQLFRLDGEVGGHIRGLDLPVKGFPQLSDKAKELDKKNNTDNTTRLSELDSKLNFKFNTEAVKAEPSFPWSYIIGGGGLTLGIALLVLLILRRKEQNVELLKYIGFNPDEDFKEDLTIIAQRVHNSESAVTDPQNLIRKEFNNALQKKGIIRLLSRDLPVSDFQRLGLVQPSYKIELNNNTYYLTKPFEDENWDRTSFFLYLVNKDGLFARGAYKSNSHSTWRIASHTTDMVDWIGKGKGESTVTMPIEIQPALEKILEDSNWQVTKVEELGRVLRRLEYLPTNSFAGGIEGYITIGGFTNSADPKSFKYKDPGLKPDFSSGIMNKFKSKSKIYKSTQTDASPEQGKIIDDHVYHWTVKSVDGSLLYLFNLTTNPTNSNKKIAWIGDIQASESNLNSYGVKKKTITPPGRLLISGNTYYKEIPAGFIGKVNPNNDAYFDASLWTNNLPPVAEFLEAVDKQGLI